MPLRGAPRQVTYGRPAGTATTAVRRRERHRCRRRRRRLAAGIGVSRRQNHRPTRRRRRRGRRRRRLRRGDAPACDGYVPARGDRSSARCDCEDGRAQRMLTRAFADVRASMTDLHDIEAQQIFMSDQYERALRQSGRQAETAKRRPPHSCWPRPFMMQRCTARSCTPGKPRARRAWRAPRRGGSPAILRRRPRPTRGRHSWTIFSTCCIAESTRCRRRPVPLSSLSCLAPLRGQTRAASRTACWRSCQYDISPTTSSRRS